MVNICLYGYNLLHDLSCRPLLTIAAFFFAAGSRLSAERLLGPIFNMVDSVLYSPVPDLNNGNPFLILYDSGKNNHPLC